MTKNVQPKRVYKVKTAYNSESSKGQSFSMLSKTVPDQAIPLRVLLDRYTRGLPIETGMRTPLYEDEDMGPSNGINMATLDLAELEQIRLKNAQTIVEEKVKIDNEERAKKAKKQEEAFEAEVKKRLNHGFIIDKDKNEPEK